jgi:NAD(P)-dependent dehydrogenase (short-subunit alcohol dehydrogenase family)
MSQYSGIRRRRVLITGATSGLGFAMAKALVSEGARAGPCVLPPALRTSNSPCPVPRHKKWRLHHDLANPRRGPVLALAWLRRV